MTQREFPKAVFLLDLVLCSVFAVPVVSDGAISLLFGLNEVLQLPGQTTAPTGIGAFAINFAGVLGVGLNIALLDPEALKAHRINLIARVAVVTLLAYHVMSSELPASFLVFAVTEVGGGVLTWRWLRRVRIARALPLGSSAAMAARE